MINQKEPIDEENIEKIVEQKIEIYKKKQNNYKNKKIVIRNTCSHYYFLLKIISDNI